MGLKTIPSTLGGKWTQIFRLRDGNIINIKVHFSNAGGFRHPHLGEVDPGKPAVREGFFEDYDLRDLTKVTQEVSNRTKTAAQTLLPPV